MSRRSSTQCATDRQADGPAAPGCALPAHSEWCTALSRSSADIRRTERDGRDAGLKRLTTDSAYRWRDWNRRCVRSQLDYTAHSAATAADLIVGDQARLLRRAVAVLGFVAMTPSNRVAHIRITSHPAPGANLNFPIPSGAATA